jgi:hypothetical protein
MLVSRENETQGRPKNARLPGFSAGFSGGKWRTMYKPGDRVVYTTTKYSSHPGPRAEDVHPEQHGEGYWYDVKKYWVVSDVHADGRLTVVTRRGKQRAVDASDRRLRLAKWWESLLFGSRFPRGDQALPPQNKTQSSAA